MDCARGPSVGFGGRAACSTTWEELTGRSYIQVPSPYHMSAIITVCRSHSPVRTLFRLILSRVRTTLVYTTAIIREQVESSDGKMKGVQREKKRKTDSDSEEVGVRSSAENITTHAAWDRYLSIIQGRSSYAPIKFNGAACQWRTALSPLPLTSSNKTE